MLPTSYLKSKKTHNSLNIYQNLMRFFFERSYKYLPLLKSKKKKKSIEIIGTCPKTPKAHFGPCGPLGVKGKK